MSYLPESMLPLEETEFPKAYDKDLHLQVSMIDRKWRRFFPQLEYYTLINKVAPTDDLGYPASERSLPEVVDEGSGGNTNPDPDHVIEIFPRFSGNFGVLRSPNTQFDSLWGESVDEHVQDAGWVQPHGNPDFAAVRKAVDKYKGPYQLHGQVRKEPKEQELKKLGFNEVRDLLVYVPLSMYDAYGIRASQGDYFIWDDTRYVVKQYNRTGWWKNTNVRLYMALNCEHLAEGS